MNLCRTDVSPHRQSVLDAPWEKAKDAKQILIASHRNKTFVTASYITSTLEGYSQQLAKD